MKKSPLKRTAFKTKKTAQKTLRNKADKLWRDAVRLAAGNKCEVCGRSSGVLHAHHLFTREIYHLRHWLGNGILLCYRCHTGDPQTSAHQNPENFRDILFEKKIMDKATYDNLRTFSQIHQKPDYNASILYLERYIKGQGGS